MLKRNGKVAIRDDQLSLFDFAQTREQENPSDRLRIDRRTSERRVAIRSFLNAAALRETAHSVSLRA